MVTLPMSLFFRTTAALFLIISLGAGAVAWEITRFAEIDQTQTADAAIVLGAGAWGNNPSPVLRERLNHAINLYRAGTVDKLILTGGVGRRSALSEAEVARRYAVGRGIPGDDILIEEQSTNTIENLSFARTIARDAGLETFLLVSTPYHMRRALWIAEDLEMKAYSSPTRTIRWLRPGTQRRALIQETLSLLVHAVRRMTGDYRFMINSGRNERGLTET